MPTPQRVIAEMISPMRMRIASFTVRYLYLGSGDIAPIYERWFGTFGKPSPAITDGKQKCGRSMIVDHFINRTPLKLISQ
jgi:hypothetical protein